MDVESLQPKTDEKCNLLSQLPKSRGNGDFITYGINPYQYGSNKEGKDFDLSLLHVRKQDKPNENYDVLRCKILNSFSLYVQSTASIHLELTIFRRHALCYYNNITNYNVYSDY